MPIYNPIHPAQIEIPDELIIELSFLSVGRDEFIVDVGDWEIIKRRIVVQTVDENLLYIVNEIF